MGKLRGLYAKGDFLEVAGATTPRGRFDPEEHWSVVYAIVIGMLSLRVFPAANFSLDCIFHLFLFFKGFLLVMSELVFVRN